MIDSVVFGAGFVFLCQNSMPGKLLEFCEFEIFTSKKLSVLHQKCNSHTFSGDKWSQTLLYTKPDDHCTWATMTGTVTEVSKHMTFLATANIYLGRVVSSWSLLLYLCVPDTAIYFSPSGEGSKRLELLLEETTKSLCKDEIHWKKKDKSKKQSLENSRWGLS